VPVQCPSDGIGRERPRERSRTMVWTQYSRRCYQVCGFTLNPSASLTDNRQSRALVNAFPKAGLGVSVAADSVVYQSDVYAASHNPIGSPKRSTGKHWGNRGVLVLIGTRLGINGVNPVYYEAIKASPMPRSFPLLVANSCPPPSGDLHVAPVSWDCWRPSIIFVLLCRFSSGQPLLPGSPPCPTRSSSASPTRGARRRS
jgi:hypothetical protein